jgi:hypothetical protein
MHNNPIKGKKRQPFRKPFRPELRSAIIRLRAACAGVAVSIGETSSLASLLLDMASWLQIPSRMLDEKAAYRLLVVCAHLDRPIEVSRMSDKRWAELWRAEWRAVAAGVGREAESAALHAIGARGLSPSPTAQLRLRGAVSA